MKNSLTKKKSWSGRGIDTTLRLYVCVCVYVSIFHSAAILSSSLANVPFLPFFALWVAALTGEKMPSAD
jgi:hypothetical protein